MKKLSQDEKEQLIRLNKIRRRKETIRVLKKEKKYDEIFRLRQLYENKLTFPPDIDWGQRLPISLPQVFSLKDNYEGVIKTVNEIRLYSLQKLYPIFLIFDNVEEIDPAAALVLTSEIYRSRHLVTSRVGRIITGNYPRNPAVYYRLKDMGFFEVLEIVNPYLGETVANQNIKYFKFKTFVKIDAQDTNSFKNSLLADAGIMDEKTQRLMQSAIIEAMSNAYEHAYKKPPPFRAMSNRSWISGSVDFDMKEVTCMLYDQGVGIPQTLDADFIDYIKKLPTAPMSGITDGYLIEKATKIGQTSTKQKGRGKGFGTMKRLVKECQDGELIVISNRGHYRYGHNSNESEGIESYKDYINSLGGTLIIWRMKQISKQLELL
jgi:hypothetical protein